MQAEAVERICPVISMRGPHVLRKTVQSTKTEKPSCSPFIASRGSAASLRRGRPPAFLARLERWPAATNNWLIRKIALCGNAEAAQHHAWNVPAALTVAGLQRTLAALSDLEQATVKRDSRAAMELPREVVYSSANARMSLK